jgi:hypothetical protein
MYNKQPVQAKILMTVTYMQFDGHKLVIEEGMVFDVKTTFVDTYDKSPMIVLQRSGSAPFCIELGEHIELIYNYDEVIG